MKKVFTLVFALFLATPMFLFANNSETEIQLLEVINDGLIGGDDQFGNPETGGYTPTHPNDFHAYISGRTLSVTSEASSNTQIRVVNRQTNQTVVNRQFSSFDSEQLPSGLYAIELQCGNLLLVGQFQTE